jgi:hypothetical protein
MTDPRTPPHTPPASPPRPATPQRSHDNPNQDPDHPANRTLSPERPPVQRSAAESFNIPPEDLMTAQESDQAGAVPGVGPASPAELSPGPAVTIEELGIGPRTPYPDGDPPPPVETVTQGQGIKGVTDKSVLKPGDPNVRTGVAANRPAPPPPPPPPPSRPPVR